jgi:Putative peptidoglycan binding domain
MDTAIAVGLEWPSYSAGYYHGAIDGIMGPATRSAIRAYERDHGYVG